MSVAAAAPAAHAGPGVRSVLAALLAFALVANHLVPAVAWSALSLLLAAALCVDFVVASRASIHDGQPFEQRLLVVNGLLVLILVLQAS